MKKILLKNKNTLLAFLLIALSVFSAVFALPTSMAKAESSAPTIQETLDNTWFVGFSKCENDKVGRAMYANYIINDGYFSPETQNYGVVIFPQGYYDAFIHEDDYIRELTEQQKVFLNVTSSNHYDITGGTFVRYGVSNIKDNNLYLQYYYIFYVQDKATGEYTYFSRKLASYPTLTQDGEVDLSLYRTNEEYSAMRTSLLSQIEDLNAVIDSKTETIADLNDTIFGYEEEVEYLNGIIGEYSEQIEELNGIIEETESIDLTNYVTKESYDRKVAELEAQIEALQSENRIIGAVERKTGLSFLQVLGIVAGAIVVIVLFCGVVSAIKKKRNAVR